MGVTTWCNEPLHTPPSGTVRIHSYSETIPAPFERCKEVFGALEWPATTAAKTRVASPRWSRPPRYWSPPWSGYAPASRCSAAAAKAACSTTWDQTYQFIGPNNLGFFETF